jgi:hypothetical protein
MKRSVPFFEFAAVPIEDPFGPSIVEPGIGCIVVSRETAKGGQAVSDERIKRGLNGVDIAIVDCIGGGLSDSQQQQCVYMCLQMRVTFRFIFFGFYAHTPNPFFSRDHDLVQQSQRPRRVQAEFLCPA